MTRSEKWPGDLCRISSETNHGLYGRISLGKYCECYEDWIEKLSSNTVFVTLMNHRVGHRYRCMLILTPDHIGWIVDNPLDIIVS